MSTQTLPGDLGENLKPDRDPDDSPNQPVEQSPLHREYEEERWGAVEEKDWEQNDNIEEENWGGGFEPIQISQDVFENNTEEIRKHVEDHEIPQAAVRFMEGVDEGDYIDSITFHSKNSVSIQFSPDDGHSSAVDEELDYEFESPPDPEQIRKFFFATGLISLVFCILCAYILIQSLASPVLVGAALAIFLLVMVFSANMTFQFQE